MKIAAILGGCVVSDCILCGVWDGGRRFGNIPSVFINRIIHNEFCTVWIDDSRVITCI